MTTGRVEHLNPEGLIRNPAFTNVVVVSGPVRTIYVGGQDAITGDGEVVGKGDLAAQTEQVLANLLTALAAAGAGPEHVIKWNLLIVEGQSIELGYAAFQRVWGNRPNPPRDHGSVRGGTGEPGLPRRDGRDRGRASRGIGRLGGQAEDVVVLDVDRPDRVEARGERALDCLVRRDRLDDLVRGRVDLRSATASYSGRDALFAGPRFDARLRRSTNFEFRGDRSALGIDPDELLVTGRGHVIVRAME